MLTLFTPTFNRAKLLQRLYASLVAQDSMDFEWLIVDDGSQDETRRQVLEWMGNAPFRISYVYQQNQGKHVAYNTALERMSGNWNCCIDSDDALDPGAINQIERDIDRCKDCDEIIGLNYPGMLDRNCTLNDLRESLISTWGGSYEFRGVRETLFVFKPDVLKFARIPVFPGEKFASEELLYLQLLNKGKLLFVNKTLVKSEYQSDGLTSQTFFLWIKNPQSTFLLLTKRISALNKFPSNKLAMIRAIMNLEAFNMRVGQSAFRGIDRPLLGFVLLVPSFGWRFIRYSQK